MADCVVCLEHRMADLVSIRGLRVLKYRGSGFAENEAPLVIGDEGIEVASFAQPLRQVSVSQERVSTGIPGLDTMLDGGLFRGSSTLITGAPGTAKSTLSGALAQAACENGERVLYVSFDEPAGQIVRNLASVNIQLQPWACCSSSGRGPRRRAQRATCWPSGRSSENTSRRSSSSIPCRPSSRPGGTCLPWAWRSACTT